MFLQACGAAAAAADGCAGRVEGGARGCLASPPAAACRGGEPRNGAGELLREAGVDGARGDGDDEGEDEDERYRNSSSLADIEEAEEEEEAGEGRMRSGP